jgi:beta-phosphoglucomutase-like phosphatase (HAD superfamily)
MTDAVIFDIDGTLLDSSSRDDEIYRQAVERILGKTNFRQGLNEYDHVSDTGILLQVLEDNAVPADEGVIAQIKAEFFDLLEAYVAVSGPFPEMPGARALIERLRNSETHEVAIATGGWQRSARIKLDTAGFDVGGIPLATSDDAIERADIMRVALDSIGRRCQAVTYFGDGPWDQQACLQLGWTFRPVGPGLNGLLSFEREFLD